MCYFELGKTLRAESNVTTSLVDWKKLDSIKTPEEINYQHSKFSSCIFEASLDQNEKLHLTSFTVIN
jgi:hypothetical protein